MLKSSVNGQLDPGGQRTWLPAYVKVDVGWTGSLQEPVELAQAWLRLDQILLEKGPHNMAHVGESLPAARLDDAEGRLGRRRRRPFVESLATRLGSRFDLAYLRVQTGVDSLCDPGAIRLDGQISSEHALLAELLVS